MAHKVFVHVESGDASTHCTLVHTFESPLLVSQLKQVHTHIGFWWLLVVRLLHPAPLDVSVRAVFSCPISQAFSLSLSLSVCVCVRVWMCMDTHVHMNEGLHGCVEVCVG